MPGQFVFDRQAYIDTLASDGLVDDKTARRHAAALDAALRDAVVTRPVFDAAIAELKSEEAASYAVLKSELAATRAELKSDISLLRQELRGDISLLRQALKTEIGQAMNRVMTWGFAAIFAAVLANGVLFRLLK
jgi:hypothetical protein